MFKKKKKKIIKLFSNVKIQFIRLKFKFLFEKTIFSIEFCGRTNQIWIQKQTSRIQTACFPYTLTMFYLDKQPLYQKVFPQKTTMYGKGMWKRMTRSCIYRWSLYTRILCEKNGKVKNAYFLTMLSSWLWARNMSFDVARLAEALSTDSGLVWIIIHGRKIWVFILPAQLVYLPG